MLFLQKCIHLNQKINLLTAKPFKYNMQKNRSFSKNIEKIQMENYNAII